MATVEFFRPAMAAGTVLSVLALSGCATRQAHERHQLPAFAAAAPSTTTESWANVMPLPGVEQSTLAYARRDAALGLPPAGYASVAGAWRAEERPSLDAYRLIPLSRSHHTFLFFTAPTQHERRAPRVPYRAHPWHTAW
jgi:hypothetical protein